MNEKCYDIGIIQAFLDGETAPALSFEITNHSASCDNCALVIAQAEEENAQVFAMLDREMNTLVPTQRLWSNITVALAEEKKQHSIWDKVRTGILAVFASPSMSVAAGVLLVFGLFAGIWTLRAPAPTGGDEELAKASAPDGSVALPVHAPAPAADSKTGAIEVKGTNYSDRDIVRIAQNADYRPTTERVRVAPAVVRTTTPSEVYLPGEESYIRTIANLKESVDGRKDAVMSPSVRVSFERDLAVVDDSIKKMKNVVRKNPKNQAAKQVLYSSYQNKIDLLNSIVEREELMASMQ